MNKKVIDAILIVMVVAVICFLIFTYNFMKSNARECLKDPIAYFEDSNDGAECNCFKDGQSYKNQTIQINIPT